MPSILVSSVKKREGMKSGLPKLKTKLPEPKLPETKLPENKCIPQPKLQSKTTPVHSSVPPPQLGRTTSQQKNQLNVNIGLKKPETNLGKPDLSLNKPNINSNHSSHKSALPTLIPLRATAKSKGDNGRRGNERDGGVSDGNDQNRGSGLKEKGKETSGEETEVNQRVSTPVRENDPQIYTDWANHYLVKSGHQRLIKDLQRDLADGVLLAQVIQVIANEKVGNINGFPKTRAHMVENIEVCLGFLASKGINIHGLCSEEIGQGNLKSILSLFFSLSKYKQQQLKAGKQTTCCDKPSNPNQANLTNIQPSPSLRRKPTGTCPNTPTSDTLTDPQQVTRGAKLSLLPQKKLSRLPAPTMHVPAGVTSEVKARSSSTPSPTSPCPAKRRSQSFSNYDQPRTSLQPATRTERSVSPCSVTMQRHLSPAPLSTSSPSSFLLPQQTSSASLLPLSSSSLSNITLTQSVLDSNSYKAWRCKSLSSKHSSTSSSLLSVKTDAVPLLSAPCKPLSLSLPQLHYQIPTQPLSTPQPQKKTQAEGKKQLQSQPKIRAHFQNKPKTHVQSQTRIQSQALSLCLAMPQDPSQSKPEEECHTQAKILEVPPKVITQKSMLEKLRLFNSKSGSKSSGGVGDVTQTDTQAGWDTKKMGKGERKPGKKGDKKAEKGPKNEEKKLEKREKKKRGEEQSQNWTSPLDDASVISKSPSSTNSTPPPISSASPTSPTAALSSPKLSLMTLGRALTNRTTSLKQYDKEKSKPKEKSVSGAKDKDKAASKEQRPTAKDRDRRGSKEKERKSEKSQRKEEVKCMSLCGPKRVSESEPLGVRQVGVGSETEPAKKSINQISSLSRKGSEGYGTKKEGSNPYISAPSSKMSLTPISSPGFGSPTNSDHSSIPKPVNSKLGKGSLPPLGGGERERRGSSGLCAHPPQTEPERHRESQLERQTESCSLSSLSNHVSSEGPHLHLDESASVVPVVGGNTVHTSAPVSTTASVQLPTTQLYNNPNTATVAPFIYRSQPDVTGAELIVADYTAGWGKKTAISKSAHSSLEDLTAVDSVDARSLLTVSNMADLRQNLQETMSNLRGTQISHCCLDSTPDVSINTSSGRTLSSPGLHPFSTLPWQRASMSRSPRLQAGDAPSPGNGYRGVPRLASRAASLESGRYLRRQQPTEQEMDKTEDIDVNLMEKRGYSSDGDMLGKIMRMDCHNTSDSAERQAGVISLHMASLSQINVVTSSLTSPARHALQLPAKTQNDYDSWDDSSSLSSEISDVFDPDDITGSSITPFINKPSVIRKNPLIELQRDCEKPGATEHCNPPIYSGADMADQSQLSAKKTPSVCQTGSWRRGMTSQVGITSTRTTNPNAITLTTCSSLKTQGTGKTDDAKASERSCLSTRMQTYGSSRLKLCTSSSEANQEEGEKRRHGAGSSSGTARTSANSTFEFKKQSAGGGERGGLMTLATPSGTTISNISTTPSKSQLPTLSGISPAASQRYQSRGSAFNSLGRQNSADDSCLSFNSKQLIPQYHSLPWPRRNHGNANSNRGNSGGTTVRQTGADVLRLSSRLNTSGIKRNVGAKPQPSNSTDREKGVGGVVEKGGRGCLMESMCESGVSAEMLPPSASKQTGDPDLVSPTTRRLLVESRSGRQTPLSSDDNLTNATVISNSQTTFGNQSSGRDSSSLAVHDYSSTVSCWEGKGNEGEGEGGGISLIPSSPAFAFSPCSPITNQNPAFSIPASGFASPDSAFSIPSKNLALGSVKLGSVRTRHISNLMRDQASSSQHSPGEHSSLSANLQNPSLGQAPLGGTTSTLGSLTTSTESMDVPLGSCGGGGGGRQNRTSGDDSAQLSYLRTNGVKMSYAISPLSSPSASPKLSHSTFPRRQDSRHGHLSPLRGDEHRDWMRSHTVGGVQESGASSPFSPCSSLTSPSGTRFALSSQLGSPTAANQMSLSALRSGGVPAGQSNQEAGNCDGFKTSNMSLDEKSRTVSTSGSIKDGVEEVNGSSLSLVSSTSSVYSTSEEKSQSEIRKLRRELEASQEKVSALTNQLNANAHLVAAFEQSLSNMTVRLQNITSNAEQKDSELNELRRTIEQLKKQNNEAQAAINTVMNTTEPSTPGECVVSEQGSPLGGPSERSEASIVRQPSTESVTSLTNSHTSLSSLGSSNNDLQNHTINSKKKKKNWLRSSFKEAFGKRRSSKSASSHSDMDDSSQPSSPNLSSNHKNQQNHSRLKASHQQSHTVSTMPQQSKFTSQTSAGLKSSHSSSLISECAPVAEAGAVMQLRSELRDKEMKLTDIRLEALSSAHQLDTLREAMTRMQNEMETLRRENMRLKTETQNHHNHNQPQSHQDQIHTHNQYPTHSNHEQHLIHNNHNSKPWQNQSQQENHNQQPPQAKSQQNSCHIREGAGRGYPPALGRTQSNSLDITESASLDMLLLDSAESIRKEGRHVKVVVSLKHHDTKATQEDGKKQFLIGCIRVSGRTKWDILDGVVRRLFKEYLLHVDPVGQLGLSSDSVLGYSIADIHLRPGLQIPELLPCGYLVGDSDTISVYLKDPSFLCADSLVFGTLVPLPIMQQYISQLQKHRSLILSGAGGLGKGFLALQLAEHIVQSERQEVKPGVITTFSFDKNNSQELQQFLCKLWDQFECRNSWPVETNLPLVVIVENLHHIPAAHAHLFKRLFNSSQHHCPYVIGTTSQNSFSLDLHLHHSHSLMLLCNKEEPVKGFLARCLRRQLLEAELSSRCQNPEMAKIVDWLPAVWRHLNHFLELHGSANASIGPGPFLSCPMAADASRLWFIDLWNYSLIPYCIEAGKQLHGSKVEWKDPADWVIDSWPWSSSPAHQDLLCLQPEDFGFSGLSKICSQAGQMAQDKDAVVSML